MLAMIFRIGQVDGQVDGELDGLLLCQANCDSGDRLFGPTKTTKTRTYPYKIAEFPSTTASFCKLGCQYYFAETPNNATCKNVCEYVYRIKTTTGYSDIAEQAVLECRDGCDIASQVCQAGFYCLHGTMSPCQSGTYRVAVTDVSIVSLKIAEQCTDCPPGRYRPQAKGKRIDDCTKCPIGKYANVAGSKIVSDCQRCPAGKSAEQEGLSSCKCINEGIPGSSSCDYTFTQNGETTTYFANDVDFYRESVPYMGRA